MPRLSCWFIRMALIHLLVGFTFGMLLLSNKGIPLHAQIWRLLPAHIELLLFGWIVQLVLGVAYWILPRFYTERRTPHLAWFAFGALNLGVWLVAYAPFSGSFSANFLLGGRVIEVAALVAFVLHAWPRVKPVSL